MTASPLLPPPPHHAAVPRSWRGMALPELLVALVIGLLVVLAAGQLMVASSRAYAAQEQDAGMDEAALHALDLITRAVRQRAAPAAVDGTPALQGRDAQVPGSSGNGLADARDGAINGSDMLAVRVTGAGTPADGSVLGCAGFAVAAQDDGWSVFHVARGVGDVPELRCRYHAGNGWGADALVAGVAGFQLLYGVDTDAVPDGVANGYLHAAAIDAIDTAGRAGDAAWRSWWGRVVSVQVALVLRGARDTVAPVPIDLFGAAYTAAATGDPGVHLEKEALAGHAHRLYRTTVALRAPGAP